MTQRLQETDRDDLLAHFLSLAADDRRLRFGASIGDAGIEAYVRGIDLSSDAVFAVRGERTLRAVVHIAMGAGPAELGLSVLEGNRRQGLGNALFAAALGYLQARGIDEVCVLCANENGPMVSLARKHRMRLAYHEGSTNGRLRLVPARGAWFNRLAARGL